MVPAQLDSIHFAFSARCFVLPTHLGKMTNITDGKNAILVSWYVAVCHSKDTNLVSEETEESLGNIK